MWSPALPTVTHHPEAADEHTPRGQQQDAGGGAGAQLGHGDEDDEEPRGDAHEPVGQRQHRVTQAQPHRGAGTVLLTGEHLQGLTPKTPQGREGAHGHLPHHAGGSRVVSLGPARGSPSIQCPPSTMDASGAGWDPRAGLSSPPRRPHTPDGIWGPGERGDIGQGVHRAPQAPPGGSQGSLTSTFWITLPKGQRKYPARSQQSCPVGTPPSLSLPATGTFHGEGTQETPTPIGAALGSSSPPRGLPNLELTIRSPHDGDEHHGSHKDVEEREPPAKEQQVKDIATGQRGPCGRGGTSWDHCHSQLPKSTLPPAGVVPKATHLQSLG